MKRLISVLIAIIIILSMTTGVFAVHKNLQGGDCYGTDTYEEHSNHLGVSYRYHEANNGSMCTVTILRMEHAVKCTACRNVLSKYIMSCTSEHSVCGFIEVECGAYD